MIDINCYSIDKVSVLNIVTNDHNSLHNMGSISGKASVFTLFARLNSTASCMLQWLTSSLPWHHGKVHPCMFTHKLFIIRGDTGTIPNFLNFTVAALTR